MRLLANVVTNRKGKFSYNWRPGGRGVLEVGVEYRTQRKSLASDSSCSRLYEIVK